MGRKDQLAFSVLNTNLRILAVLIAVGGTYYMLRKDMQIGMYRSARKEPIPLPETDADQIAFRAAICMQAERGDEITVDSILNEVYRVLGARWPTVPGDHPSMTSVKTYVASLIDEYQNDSSTFCQTGPA